MSEEQRRAFDAEASEDYAMQTYDTHEEQFAFVDGCKWQSALSSPQGGEVG